jgi:hypothetical protein
VGYENGNDVTERSMPPDRGFLYAGATSVAPWGRHRPRDALVRLAAAVAARAADRTPIMITRLWRGWTTTDNADAYERFLLDGLFPSMRAIPGFRGADVLRRAEHHEVAFITLTRFDSVNAIRAFAGDDYETPVLEPQALALLSRYERRALHFDTARFTA